MTPGLISSDQIATIAARHDARKLRSFNGEIATLGEYAAAFGEAQADVSALLAHIMALHAERMLDQVRVVFSAIMRERDYQDSKWGNVETNPHTIYEWIGIMEKELQEAKAAYFERPADDEMLCEILQVAAVAVACMQQHGLVERTMLPAPHLGLRAGRGIRRNDQP